jgi:signal transduction histidine kinase
MIARKIVDEHGGVIDLSSEKGSGTVFMVRLPEKKQSA